MEVKICNKCLATNIDTLVPRLKEIDSNINIVIGCQNMCGIGMTKSFAIVDHIPVIADSEDELVTKIKQLKKEE